jgi:hypothetical protein
MMLCKAVMRRSEGRRSRHEELVTNYLLTQNSFYLLADQPTTNLIEIKKFIA